MPLIEKLSWDSNFFNMPIGKYIIDDEFNFDPTGFLYEAKNNYDLVYVFSHKNMLSLPNVIAANLDLVDIIITMSMPLIKKESPVNGFDFRTDLTENEIAECYEIAEQTSVVSRFFNEPLIGQEKAKALYRKWIDNSLNNTFNDGILLSKSEDIITGIHVIKTDSNNMTGSCSLIGVKNSCKGKGTGKNLWEQAFCYWTLHGGINKCEVPFSIRNSESFNFHLKLGFNKIEEIKYIYHYRNN